MLAQRSANDLRCEVLLSHRREQGDVGWLLAVDTVLGPTGLTVCHAHSGPDTIRRVECGGLAGAVLVADDHQIDGLSLLRVIRTIDADLPCWLVTADVRRPTLQAASALGVCGVMTYPRRANELAIALRRWFVN